MKNPAIIISGVIGSLFVVGTLVWTVTGVRGVTSAKRSTQAEMPFLQSGLSLYFLEYGTLPKETSNAKIFEILTGKNPGKLRFYSAPGDELAVGQLLDGWERPYVFQNTSDNMVIRSAGKDGIPYTNDDLTLEVVLSHSTANKEPSLPTQ